MKDRTKNIESRDESLALVFALWIAGLLFPQECDSSEVFIESEDSDILEEECLLAEEFDLF